MKDQDGFTPLHLTVKAAEKLQSGRPLRALLMKGAKRDVRDNNGKTPYDLADELEKRKLATELKKNLSEASSCNCLLLSSSLEKIEKSMQMPFVFCALFNSIFSVLLFLLFPRWHSESYIYITIFFGLMTDIFWFKLQWMDPGHMYKPRDVDFLVSHFQFL